MEDAFDTIVVGAGPAGSAAAREVVRAGLSCALLDKAAFPRDKLCGGLFTGRSRRALAEVFDLAPDPDLFLPCEKMRFAASGRILSEFAEAPLLHLAMRKQMDAWLREHSLAAGAQAVTGTLEAVDAGKRQVILRGGRRIGYGVLIGADGVNSAVARALFGQAFNKDTIGFGLEIEAPHAALAPGERWVEVDFNAAAWGYGWRLPE